MQTLFSKMLSNVVFPSVSLCKFKCWDLKFIRVEFHLVGVSLSSNLLKSVLNLDSVIFVICKSNKHSFFVSFYKPLTKMLDLEHSVFRNEIVGFHSITTFRTEHRNHSVSVSLEQETDHSKVKWFGAKFH